MKNLTILGATGSIGENTLRVVREHRDKFQIYALSAYSQVDKLLTQINEFNPEYAVVVNSGAGEYLQKKVKKLGLRTKILIGADALVDISTADKVDMLMAAIVGIAGLLPTYQAVCHGKTILLANKEVLVTAGNIFMKAVKKHKVLLLPVDSEHNAIFQCLPQGNRRYDKKVIDEIILTASGGPFLNSSLEDLHDITPDEACAHPNWEMGRKISIDSSTMMNKALEIIEAYWLFNIPIEKLKVLIHPQSIVHSMVKYHDGSFLAQMASPDMQTPIAYAMFYPKRGEQRTKPLDLTAQSLSFAKVDKKRFLAVTLAYKLLAEKNYAATIVLNAANEELVDAFLQQRIAYLDIVPGVAKILKKLILPNPKTINDVINIDKEVRNFVHNQFLA